MKHNTATSDAISVTPVTAVYFSRGKHHTAHISRYSEMPIGIPTSKQLRSLPVESLVGKDSERFVSRLRGGGSLPRSGASAADSRCKVATPQQDDHPCPALCADTDELWQQGLAVCKEASSGMASGHEAAAGIEEQARCEQDSCIKHKNKKSYTMPTICIVHWSKMFTTFVWPAAEAAPDLLRPPCFVPA